MTELWARRRAEKAAEKQLELAPPPPTETPESTASEDDRPLNRQPRPVVARWAGEQATEEELRKHFNSIPLEKAFALYEKMRRNMEIVGKILNQRSNIPEVQKCKTCGVTFDDFQKTSRKNDWFLNRPRYKDGDRNIIMVEHFCSAACISLENNKTQGVYGISDRGMLRSDNPRNHPRDLPKEAS
jgi:hypothetical protein